MMRNYALDFFRGLATLSIILIHTVFWSGELYLPSKVSNLSLLIDVPVFMFIAGIAFNYSNSILKNIKGILVQWKKWIYFIIVYSLILIVFFNEQFSFKELFSWLVYIFPKDNGLVVVGGSIWFIPMYIKVTLLCSIIICIIKHFDVKNELKDLKLVTLFMLFIFLYNQSTTGVFILDSTVSFYSFIYLLGYMSYSIKIDTKRKFTLLQLMNILLLVFIFYSLKLNLSDIQNTKFPPTLPYLLVSMISIYIVWYFKDIIKIKEKNPVVFIGQNAIFYYFAQGIGSSLLYIISPYVNFSNWIIKLACMLTINLIITSLIAIILIFMYKKIDGKKNLKKFNNILKL